MKQLLQKLTETFSPSGYESAIRDIIRAEIEPLADEIHVDALGNLVARKGRGGTKIMIAAHMDEIGLVATHIDANGFVRFTSIGGVYPQMLMGGRVRFANGTPGVIYTEPLEKPTDTPAMEKMFIDVGAASNKNHPIKIGDVAAFERPFLDLGDRVVAKSMDDRIGCYVAIETLRALKETPHEVYFVFTTQEEVGTRGAGTAAYGLDPEIGIALDVTGWGDTPGRKHFEMYLGKGPAVKIKDGGMLADPRVVDWMIRTAERSGIPYQREVLLGGTTDARAMQVARAGIPAGCISIPCRYVHSPSEMVDFNDVQNAVRLLTAMLAVPVVL
ncbi:MAG: M42 family metallopeptidase [Anaerolineales bacterium]